MELTPHQKRKIVETLSVERKIIQKKVEDYATKNKIEDKEQLSQALIGIIKPFEKLVVRAFLCSIEEVDGVKN